MKATDLEHLTTVILACWQRVELTIPELQSVDNFIHGENKMGLCRIYVLGLLDQNGYNDGQIMPSTPQKKLAESKRLLQEMLKNPKYQRAELIEALKAINEEQVLGTDSVRNAIAMRNANG